MVITSEIGIISNIIYIIVHKSHIPFQIKSKPPIIQFTCNLWKSGTFFSDCENTGISFFHDGIKMLHHLDRFEVLITAINICNPLSILFSIIQVQHTGNRIHTDSVHMVFFYPEKSICYQIVGHLRSSIIIYQGSPVSMKALSGISVFIETCSVKIRKPIYISREMCGNPVQYYSYSRLVKFIDKIHKILWCAISCSRSIITNDLITPGFIQRMFHNGHQLYMCEAHIFQIRNQTICNVPIVCKFRSFLPFQKRTKIHLIYTDRRLGILIFSPSFYEFIIFPAEIR